MKKLISQLALALLLLLCTSPTLAQLCVENQTSASCGTPPPTVPLVTPANSGATDVLVPIAFHVLYCDEDNDPDCEYGAENIPIERIEDQIALLDAEFAGTGFSFYLAALSRTYDSDLVVHGGPPIVADLDYASELALDPARVLNVYSLDICGGDGGAFSYILGEPLADPRGDGIVTEPQLVGGDPETGRILAHEVGHWLGLYHTFAGLGMPDAPGCYGASPTTCGDNGDYVCDTAPMDTIWYAYTNCGAPPNSCPDTLGPGGSDLPDPISSLMGYTVACRDSFTAGQIGRMRKMAAEYRAELVATSGDSLYLYDGLTLKDNQTWEFRAPLAVEAGKQLTLGPNADLTLGADLVVESGGRLVTETGAELRAASGVSLLAEGELEATGTTFTEADAGQGWDGILVAGTFDADGATVEHAATGVAVYEPGTADLAGSTLRFNGVGLDVRSAGVTVSGSTIEHNGDGVLSGFLGCYGVTCPCFTSCRSAFKLDKSPGGDSTRVRNNTNAGVRVIDSDAEITFTEITGNGFVGVGVSNGYVEPFERNVIENNGSRGVAVIAGGSLLMGSPSPNRFGYNRVANNALSEVLVYNGGMAFLGSSLDNGRNSVYDDVNGGLFLRNLTSATVYAKYTFWNTLSPASDIAGPVVFTPVSDCDYTVTPVNCIAARPGDGLASSRGTWGPAEGNTPLAGDLEVEIGEEMPLGEEIRSLRAALAANPASGDAPGLVYELGALHRRDRGDALGEWTATEAVLSALRASLAAPELSGGERATAEAALEVEAVAALGNGETETASELIRTWGPRAESGSVGRVLGLVEAHLEAGAGRYAEAAALVEAVAASEPEEDLRGELRAVAAVYGRSAGQEGAGVGGAVAAASQELEAEASRASGAASLAVFPNPAAGRAVVRVEVPERGELRVEVFDVLGRRVAALADGTVEAGRHRFAVEAARLPAGVYVVRAASGTFAASQRLTVVR